MVPHFSPRQVLDALRAGKARDFTDNDRSYFSGAPEGSCILEGAEWGDWLVIVGAGFQVEAHAVDADGDPFFYCVTPDGDWDAY